MNDPRIPLKTNAIQRDGGAVGRSLWLMLFEACVASLTASLGALFIGEVMGQAPFRSCWYQRTFMFPLAVVLGVGAFLSVSALQFFIVRARQP